jgi:hypothetical protein
MRFSDSHHFRKMVAGFCMVAGSLFALASFVVSPRLETDEAKQLAVVADHLDRWYISSLLGAIAVALLVPATLGLMHMLREKHAGYGHVGGALSIVGLLATMASTGVALMMWQMAKNGVDPTDVSTLKALNDSAGYVIPVIAVGTLGTVVGYVALAAGLSRAHAVDWWMAALIALGPIGINAGFLAGSLAVSIAGAALLFVGLGSIGAMVLRESDADWEHTPEYRGMRPAAGLH